MGLFAHDTITLDGIVCEIDPEKCTGCRRCYQQCPFQAVELITAGDKTMARIINSACKGCGVCAGACSEGAVIAHGFTDEMLLAQIDAFWPRRPGKKSWPLPVTGVLCRRDFAVSRLEYPATVRLIRTMCCRPPKLVHVAKGAGHVPGHRLPSTRRLPLPERQPRAKPAWKIKTQLAARVLIPTACNWPGYQPLKVGLFNN
jgi:heterodisulfide reductase subunit A